MFSSNTTELPATDGGRTVPVFSCVWRIVGKDGVKVRRQDGGYLFGYLSSSFTSF